MTLPAFVPKGLLPDECDSPADVPCTVTNREHIESVRRNLAEADDLLRSLHADAVKMAEDEATLFVPPSFVRNANGDPQVLSVRIRKGEWLALPAHHFAKVWDARRVVSIGRHTTTYELHNPIIRDGYRHEFGRIAVTFHTAQIVRGDLPFGTTWLGHLDG